MVAATEARVVHHFDPQRLTRRAFLDAAVKHGRSMAYIAHHWGHRDLTPETARLARLRRRLLLKRLRRPGEVVRREGCALWEMLLVQDIAQAKQAAIEMKRDRNYVRHGLMATPESMLLDTVTADSPSIQVDQ